MTHLQMIFCRNNYSHGTQIAGDAAPIFDSVVGKDTRRLHGRGRTAFNSPWHSVNTEPIFGAIANSVPQKLVPIGSLKNLVLRKFSSVSVFTEQYRTDHIEDVIADSKTNFNIIS